MNFNFFPNYYFLVFFPSGYFGDPVGLSILNPTIESITPKREFESITPKREFESITPKREFESI